MNVTLDPHCIIDLIEDRLPHANYLAQLVVMHNAGAITLRVVAIGACERQPDGIFAATFEEFRARIAAAGLEYVEVLRPPFAWGITFDDWSTWCGDEAAALERALHAALFDRIAFDWSEYRDNLRDGGSGHQAWPRGVDVLYARWRSARTTVLALSSHIRHAGTIYVSRDELLLQGTRRRQLARLGAGSVLTPRQAAVRLAGDLNIV